MILPVLFLATTATSAAGSSSRIPTKLVARQIDIQSDWYGLDFQTPHQEYHVVLTAKGGVFPKEYRTRITAFLRAVEQPATNRLTAADIFGDVGQTDGGSGAPTCLGDAYDLPSVQKAAHAIYQSPANQLLWIDTLYWPPGNNLRGLPRETHTDDYPRVRVVVRFTNGAVAVIASDSQTQYMLPFNVAFAGKTVTTYSTAIPKAIALLIAGNLNSDRLSGHTLSDEYWDWLCEREAAPLADAAFKAYIPRAWALWHRQSWIPDTTLPPTLGPDLRHFEGIAHLPAWRQAVFYFHVRSVALDRSALQAGVLRTLPRAAAAGSRIDALPWLRSWLAKHNKATLTLQSLYDPDTDRAPLLANLQDEAPALFWRVHALGDKVFYGELSSGLATSYWFFLPKGDSILVAYSGDTPLGPLRASLVHARPGDDAFDHFAAVLIDAAGKLRPSS